MNQQYESVISDEVFNTISKKLHNDCIICELLDRYFEYENKHTEKIETAIDLDRNSKQNLLIIKILTNKKK